MRLVILGPQGAGKGTQSARLSEKYGIASIATGDIFRWAISEGTEVGSKAREYVDAGRLVPDELTIAVVTERLVQDDVRDGFVLDGFPRNIEQAEALDGFLDARGLSLDRAVVLEVSEEMSLHRLLGRRVCSGCGRNYHIDDPPQRDWVCDRCGRKVVARSDDNEETIRERLRHYAISTAPLKAYYEDKRLLQVVAGDGAPDDVFERIVSEL